MRSEYEFSLEKPHIDILRYLTQLWMDDPENCMRTTDQIADGIGVTDDTTIGLLPI